jgi:hypothetical protein
MTILASAVNRRWPFLFVKTCLKVAKSSYIREIQNLGPFIIINIEMIEGGEMMLF